MATAKKPRRRKKAEPAGPIGLTPAQTLAKPPEPVESLCKDIQGDGGAVLSAYREPLGGRWVIMAALPLEQVEPTPYQRGLSDTHVKRLVDVISRSGLYLDPVIAVRVGPKQYQTPNGHHRATAMKQQGARAITALVVTEPQVARLILALNVEKAHNLREKSSEVIRLARHLAELPEGREQDYALEFEEAAFLTLGLCYEQNGRFAGGAYHPILKRVDEFLDMPLPKSVARRGEYAEQLLKIDARVSEIVAKLKAKGLESPYLRNFVVARINPIRFLKGKTMPIEDTLDKMAAAAAKFNTDKINVSDLARSGAAAAGSGEE
jgi:ParB family chromosome partitioning protein